MKSVVCCTESKAFEKKKQVQQTWAPRKKILMKCYKTYETHFGIRHFIMVLTSGNSGFEIDPAKSVKSHWLTAIKP